jgi:hypothetical protein
MLQQGRCRGDFLRRSYRLASPEVERAFHLFMGSMAARNFGDDSAVLRLSILRFEIEACRLFHPTLYRKEWQEHAVAITRRLSLHTADVLDAIVQRCASEDSVTGDAGVATELESACHQVDEKIIADAKALAAEMRAAVGQPAPCDTWHASASPAGFPIPPSES